jgi:glutaredoxin-related protein
MYYLKIITLEKCPYSDKVIELLNIHKIEYKNKIINNINKNIYKNSFIDTFPQIYLKKNNTKGSLLLGGCSDLIYCINLFKNNNNDNDNDNDNDNHKKKFIDKYKWSDKATTRLIELIN